MCPLLEVIHRIPTSLDDVQVVDGVNRRQITKETAIQEDFDDRCMIHQRVWAVMSVEVPTSDKCTTSRLGKETHPCHQSVSDLSR